MFVVGGSSVDDLGIKNHGMMLTWCGFGLTHEGIECDYVTYYVKNRQVKTMERNKRQSEIKTRELSEPSTDTM